MSHIVNFTFPPTFYLFINIVVFEVFFLLNCLMGDGGGGESVPSL